MNVYKKVMAGANINLAAPVFISTQGCMTYGQFVSLIGLSAKGLHQAGIGKGVVVAICMDNSALHAAVVVALAQLGATSIGIHPQTSTEKLTQTITRFGAQYVVRDNEVPEIASVKNIQFGQISFTEGEHFFNLADHGITEPEAKDPARLVLTSHTTGDVHGFLMTQSTWIERVEKTVDLIESDSRVICPDIYGYLGNIFLLGTLFAGGTIVLARTKAYPELMFDIAAYATTHLIIPPHVLQGMIPYLPKSGIAFPSIKHLRPIGSSLSESLLGTLINRISPNVYFPYGIDEVGAIAIATPAMLKKYPSTSGKLKAWSKAQVVDENDQALPAGKVGRFRIQVEGMASGYYQEPKLTKEHFRDGWFYTGDQGYIDKNGYLFIQENIDDVIDLNGIKLNPTLQKQSSPESNLLNTKAPNRLEAAKAANHRAIALTRKSDFLGAIKEFDQALAIYPHFLDALNNKSAALLATGQTIKAKACALTALDIEPQFDAVRINLAFAQLKLGEFKEGWKNYDYRWSGSSEAVSGKLQRFSTNLPNWRGEVNTQQQNLVVLTEQGYGDVFQFSRYLPLLKQRFAKVGFATSKETFQVMCDSFGNHIKIIGNTEDLKQGWHWQCDLMSLPLAMGTELHTIPCQVPYLKATAQKKAFWQERLAKANTKKKRIGIAWTGRSSHQFDSLRSMTFKEISSLLDIDGITWVSLQKEAQDIPGPGQMPEGKWLDWTKELDDFSDTAALISNLDLVVSIDSAMAHLAGGLNLPVALLNRYSGEWRWLEHTDETPWYPNTHIFNQSKLGDWQTTLAELKTALQKFVQLV